MQAFTLGPIQTKWVESLENNPERQVKGQLGKKNEDGSYTACCLGEGALIAGCAEWNDEGVLWTGDTYGYLDGKATVALGLKDSTGARFDKDGSLTQNNDLDGLTWPEIAAKIRSEPEQYFTHSV